MYLPMYSANRGPFAPSGYHSHRLPTVSSHMWVSHKHTSHGQDSVSWRKQASSRPPERPIISRFNTHTRVIIVAEDP